MQTHSISLRARNDGPQMATNEGGTGVRLYQAGERKELASSSYRSDPMMTTSKEINTIDVVSWLMIQIYTPISLATFGPQVKRPSEPTRTK